MKTWLLIFGCMVYFAFSWALYTIGVEPLYGLLDPPAIAADSPTYFERAGIGTNAGIDTQSIFSIGGGSAGQTATALVFRNEFGVACFDCLFALAIIYWAGLIPGVRRTYFAILMALEPQTLPTIMTLNKEIFAIAGLVTLAAYIYSGNGSGRVRRSKWLLFLTIIFSICARWEQLIVPMWYLAMESRWSPFRGKPRRGLAVLLLFCSVAWAAAVHVLHLNLGGFVAQIKGAGTITRLYSIQEKGGYFLVAIPKIIMNISGRWVTPAYFLHDYWVQERTNSWQNEYIGVFSSFVMLIMVAVAFFRGRIRVTRPAMYLAWIYCIYTSVNPFVQHRYIYPAYALIVLELSRRKEALEPVRPLPKPPALPPSYRTWTHSKTAIDSGNAGRDLPARS